LIARREVTKSIYAIQLNLIYKNQRDTLTSKERIKFPKVGTFTNNNNETLMLPWKNL